MMRTSVFYTTFLSGNELVLAQLFKDFFDLVQFPPQNLMASCEKNVSVCQLIMQMTKHVQSKKLQLFQLFADVFIVVRHKRITLSMFCTSMPMN